MLFWTIVGIFGVSLGLIWHQSKLKAKEREYRLKKIRDKIKENDAAKKRNKK